MSRLRLYLIALLCGLNAFVHAQDAGVQGLVTDAATGEPIPFCSILIEGTDTGTSTDIDGSYTLRLPNSAEPELLLNFITMGYATKQIRIALQDSQGLNEVKTLNVRLEGKAILLEPVPINSERIPEVVYGSQQHSVEDYCFLANGEVLLLAYEKRLSKASKLYRLDADMQAIDSLNIPANLDAVRLERDYLEQVYVICETGPQHLYLKHGPMRLMEVDAQLYVEQIHPIIDSLDSRYFFPTWRADFPAFDYYAYSAVDSSYTHIYQVADAFMLELCRAEYKYLSGRDKLKLYRLELESGVEKEVLACMAMHDNTIYYQPLYAPMFVIRDSLYLFDHAASRLCVMSAQGDSLHTCDIKYHNPERVINNPFHDELIHDKLTGSIYAVMRYAGGRTTLWPIDLFTGETASPITLTYDYPQGVQVRGGEVYYTYRPFESLQKKYVYREDISEEL